MGGQDPRILIINALNKHPEGLTIASLAKATGLHRHTSSKYLHELIGAGLIYQRKVGPAMLCYLKKKIDRKGIKKLEKKWKVGEKSQVKIITLVLLLSLIFISSVAIASNIPSNFTGLNVLSNFSYASEIPKENQSVEGISNETIEQGEKIGILEGKPSVSIELTYPERVNRGEEFEVVASIKNSGPSSAKNLKVEWALAENFEIVSEVNGCESLEPDSSCEDRITVLSNLSCKLGENELKVRVAYEA